MFSSRTYLDYSPCSCCGGQSERHLATCPYCQKGKASNPFKVGDVVDTSSDGAGPILEFKVRAGSLMALVDTEHHGYRWKSIKHIRPVGEVMR